MAALAVVDQVQVNRLLLDQVARSSAALVVDDHSAAFAML